MANPPTDRLVKAELRFTWNNQLVENVLHFRHTLDSANVESMTELGEFLEAQVNPDWLAQMATTVTFREVYVEEYAGGISQTVTIPGSGTGAAAGNSMAGNNAFCLSLRTEFAGRSRRGRFYTIGMTENHQDAGVVTSTYRDAWLTNLDQIRIGAPSIFWELVVASFWSGGEPRGEGLVTPVQAIIAVDNFCDSQRRRLQGRGS